jgi:hypothetical protein
MVKSSAAASKLRFPDEGPVAMVITIVSERPAARTGPMGADGDDHNRAVSCASSCNARTAAMNSSSFFSSASTAGRKFVRDRAGHGNESGPSWIEGTWIPARDLAACASRESSGRASRPSRGVGTLSMTLWSGRGSSCGCPMATAQPRSRCSSGAAVASCASGEPGGRPARASSRSLTRRGAAGHLAYRCRPGRGQRHADLAKRRASSSRASWATTSQRPAVAAPASAAARASSTLNGRAK